VTTRVTDLFLTGTHGARPAESTVPVGALYACTTHNKVYKNVAGTWTDWYYPTFMTDPSTTKGDLLARTSSALVRKAVGTDGYVLKADSSQTDGLAWNYPDSAVRTFNTQAGTSYTLALSDIGKFVTMSNASASTLTVPPNSSVAFPTGTVIEGAQYGAGQVTLTPGSGVTINASPGLKIAAQWGTFGLIKTAIAGADTWLAYGRLAA
jgi:hypothetical protein